MGEEPRSVTEKAQNEEQSPEEKWEQDPEEQVGHLEEEIAETRERLGVYLSELDHRRHRAMKLVKRGGALVLGLTALTVVAIAIVGRRKAAESDDER
jgi:hypothetical protein